MKLLLDRNPNIKITEAVVVAAVGHYSGTNMINQDPNIEITETVLVVAARNENDANARKVMELLLDRDPTSRSLRPLWWQQQQEWIW